ncbi:MAG: tRNA (N6-isopentenyl adenosine(37)-C2)-methylthiotransferase MiaB [Bryobacterales bacterium]|nr:tRNA (N6-isopentenyl adenosine(37)-C2)-methylthiotransferase MiaB [Bryobacterales bacterium]
MKRFYIETFGCQMNVHDSEKVAGTLIARGYRQVDKPEQADLILYNTCSIRDKAEQKVYSRLQQFKRDNRNGRVFAVLGCVAEQEGERIFERAPHVGLVCGSASYNRLPELLARIEDGDRRVTGLGLDAQETFETPVTQRDNPHRASLTIIEGCDKSCAYCVVPATRGPERSRSSQLILTEACELADAGRGEIQLLGQNVNSYRDPSPAAWDFVTLLRRVAQTPGLRRVRFTTSHPRDFVGEIVDAIDENPVLCNHVHLPVQSGSSAVLERMQRLYTRPEYLARIEWIKRARRQIAISTDIIVGFPGETQEEFDQTLSLLDEVGYDSVFSFKYSPRPNTPALALPDQVPEQEKGRRLLVLQERQRAIQIRRNSLLIGRREEVLVEGFNAATGQWIGRTSQNRTLNFTHASLPAPDGRTLVGRYLPVRVTRAGPNSLVGESADLI